MGDALTIFPPSEATFRICVDAKYFNWSIIAWHIPPSSFWSFHSESLPCKRVNVTPAPRINEVDVRLSCWSSSICVTDIKRGYFKRLNFVSIWTSVLPNTSFDAPPG